MSEIGLFETIHSARAIRHFRADPVPHEVLTKVLEAAVQAPSAGNRQNWLFVVMTDDAQRRQIADVYRRASAWVREVYLSNAAGINSGGGARRGRDGVDRSVGGRRFHLSR